MFDSFLTSSGVHGMPEPPSRHDKGEDILSQSFSRLERPYESLDRGRASSKLSLIAANSLDW